MAKGWYGNKQAHSMASKGIKTKISDIKGIDSGIINSIIQVARKKVKDPTKFTQGNCVEFAKAMRDLLGSGENYQLYGHNYLKYGDLFIDGRGVHTRKDIESKWTGGKISPDPDGWSYIYNMEALESYRKILKDAHEETTSNMRMIE